MSGFWIVIGAGIVLLLIGYIVIQRRRPQDADKIASDLDAAWKAAKDKAAELAKGKQ